MATKRTAGLLAGLVVLAAVVAVLLTTCEDAAEFPATNSGAPAVADGVPATRPVAQRRARAVKGESAEEQEPVDTGHDLPPDVVDPGPLVLVAVEVVDAETGRAVASATVSNFVGEAVTDAAGQGSIRLRRDQVVETATRAAGHLLSIDYVRTAPVGSAQPSLRIELVSAGALHGVVRDPDGNPVEGAVVDVRRDDVDDVLQSEPSAADGAYVVEGLVFGAAYTAMANDSTTVADTCGSADSPPLVPTREHPVVVADLRLRRHGKLELSVFDGDDPIDNSLKVKVFVSFVGDDGGRQSTTGGFDSPLSVTPGLGTLTVTYDDCAPYVETLDIAEGATVKKPIHLTRGESISGCVVDDAGEPVGDAWVRDGAASDDDAHRHQADARSKADGAFELTQLTTGDHELRVSPPFEFDDVVVRAAAPSENVRLVVPRRGVLKLRAVFDGDAKPAADARIAFHGTLDGKPWDIDRLLPRDGRFEIPWPAGVSGDVGIAVDGFVPVTRSMTVPPGTAVDLGEIRMQPACSLAGVLRHDDGAPWNEATLVVRGVMGEWKCKTSSTGRFSFGRLAAGALRVDLADSPHASFLADVPSVKDVVLVVPKSGLLQVFASNSSGQRLAARRVDVVDADGVTVDSGTTDANGSWTSHIVAGGYRVSVENGPHADAEVRAEDVTVLRLR